MTARPITPADLYAIGDGMIELDSREGRLLGFTSDKFDGWLWKDGGEMVISMIVSKHEGRGNLSALFERIEGAGFKIIVPTPFPRMESILKHKGFTEVFYRLTEIGRVEMWRKPEIVGDILACEQARK